MTTVTYLRDRARPGTVRQNLYSSVAMTMSGVVRQDWVWLKWRGQEQARASSGVAADVESLHGMRLPVQSSLYATKGHRLLPLQRVVLASLILLGNR